MQNGQFGSKIKNAKDVRKTILPPTAIDDGKTPNNGKTPNSRKMRAFRKWPKLATMHGL